MIFTIGNTKGGVGKSTLAVNLAITMATRGRSVWLVDGDRQGTSSMAMGIRADNGKLPLIHCSHLPDEKELNAALVAEAAQFDCVIVDAGGRDRPATVAHQLRWVRQVRRSFSLTPDGSLTIVTSTSPRQGID